MKLSVCVFTVLFFGLGSAAQGLGASYDSLPSASHVHESYAPYPDAGGGHGHGHSSHGQSAGSYYHYHVPVLSQGQQHHQPSHQSYMTDHSHHLWALLLLLAIPLISLKLLPLLLIPLGLSLLALLGGGAGAMMMMMMMMMMMPMMMPQPNARNENAGRLMDTMSQVVMGDVSGILSKYASSIDMDQCPQRIFCEVGSKVFPENVTAAQASGTTRAVSAYVFDRLTPKGKSRKGVRRFEKAFWTGAGTKNCTKFKCQPSFRGYPTQTNSGSEVWNTNKSQGSLDLKDSELSSGTYLSNSTGSQIYKGSMTPALVHHSVKEQSFS